MGKTLRSNFPRKQPSFIVELMRYLVKARFIEGNMKEFYRNLTDGTIASQKPDGQEIVSSMKRAKITGPTDIVWCETCFCPTPLAHERETVYDHYLTEIETTEIDSDPEIQGDSFWDQLTLEG